MNEFFGVYFLKKQLRNFFSFFFLRSSLELLTFLFIRDVLKDAKFDHLVAHYLSKTFVSFKATFRGSLSIYSITYKPK